MKNKLWFKAEDNFLKSEILRILIVQDICKMMLSAAGFL